MSLNSRVSITSGTTTCLPEHKVLSSGINATGWVRSLKDFDFFEELGKGSFSRCCRCVHRESGKQYAVKVSAPFVKLGLCVTDYHFTLDY